MRDPASAFLEYPEMRKMWLLLDYLPELYLTFDYTAQTNPNKVCCSYDTEGVGGVACRDRGGLDLAT